MARAPAVGVDDSVRFPGWVDAAQLEALYAEAECLAFPSKREGFGLPPHGAMNRGLPVICARASALPEVAGHAALYFDPESSEDLSQAVGRILSDAPPAPRLAVSGR